MDTVRLTSIKKKNRRYELIIADGDNSFIFKIGEDLLVESRFFAPRELSQTEYQSFLNKLPLDSLVYEGEKYVLRKDRSAHKVREYLLSLSSEETLVDEAIEALKRKNLIDDDHFLETYLDYAINVKKDGPLKIRRQLILYGLSPSFFYPPGSLKKNIMELTKKYDAETRNMPRKAKIDKIKNHLLRKGYRQDEVDDYFSSSSISASDDERMFAREVEKLRNKGEDAEKMRKILTRKGYPKNLIDTL